MSTLLYPLKFNPILKDKIWGGDKLKSVLKKSSPLDNLGESWEISGIEGDISVVNNGFLAGNTLEEIIEIYMSEIVGEYVFNKFDKEFPLLRFLKCLSITFFSCRSTFSKSKLKLTSWARYSPSPSFKK